MPAPVPTGYALNRTRQAYLARHLRIAETHWSRFCGLMCTDAGSFPAGQGLWIVPSRGATSRIACTYSIGCTRASCSSVASGAS